MPFVVREIQQTPNPNAKKFVLDRPIVDHPTSFLTTDQAAGHPLASQLFSISGVTSVFMLGDFITINKLAGAKWPGVTKRVQKILKDF